jgi:sirohydrochlorin cobaltochelatase
MTLTEPRPAGIGVLLCGHGSRSETAVEEFARLAEALRPRFPDWPVEYGYLEFANPVIRDGLDALRRQGVGRILAVPGMLFAASHAKNDIPSVLNTYARTHGIAVDYGRELGVDARMLAAAADRVRAAVAALDARDGPVAAADTTLVVVGRGASDPDANANVAKMARLLWEGFGFGWCETAYSGVTFPLVEPCLERVARLAPKRVIVFPYFLFSGILVDRIYGFTDAVAARHPGIAFGKAAYLGDHPAVIDTFAERVTEILDGQAVMNCGLCKYRTQVLGFEAEVGAPQASHHHHFEGMGASAPGSSVGTCDLCTTFCTGACRLLRPSPGHHADADAHGHHHHDPHHHHDHDHHDHHHDGDGRDDARRVRDDAGGRDRHDGRIADGTPPIDDTARGAPHHDEGHSAHGHPARGDTHGHPAHGDGADDRLHPHHAGGDVDNRGGTGSGHRHPHPAGGHHTHGAAHMHPTYPHADHPLGPVSVVRGGQYTYERDPAAIIARSFAIIRAEADLGRFGGAAPVAERIAHAAGDIALLDDLVVSGPVVAAGRSALRSGATVVVDSEMTRHAILTRLVAPERILCRLNEADTAAAAAAAGTTRSAIAIRRSAAALDGGIAVIGNAPTALFELLALLREGVAPALILAFPVGFVGAAESKAALVAMAPRAPFATLRGRRGGSAIAGAALNAVAGADTGEPLAAGDAPALADG